MKDLIERLHRNIQKYRFDLENNGVSVSVLDSNVQIESLINSLNLKNKEFKGTENKVIENKKNDIKVLDNLINQTKSEIIENKMKLNIEGNKKTSLYSNHKDKIQFFQRQLEYFNKYITDNNKLIKDDGGLSVDANDKNPSYIKLIGEFVASTMGNSIIYQDEALEISHIDYSIKTPCFVTIKDKRIAFSDFSGGQASSNYLKSKLNVNDNKKYIVLFDEIANMDDRSLNEVIKKLKILNENNKLVLAILSEPHKEQNEFVINAY